MTLALERQPFNTRSVGEYYAPSIQKLQISYIQHKTYNVKGHILISVSIERALLVAYMHAKDEASVSYSSYIIDFQGLKVKDNDRQTNRKSGQKQQAVPHKNH